MNLANVNLYHLKYFYDVTQLSSFSKAAEANFVSRPAISKAILRLEEIIGYTLFDHEKKLVRLTKEGKQLAAQLEPILNQLERAIAQQLSVEQSLRLGVSYSIFKSLLLHPLSTFLLKEKNSKIKTQFGASRQLVSLLSSGEIDFAILLDRLDQRVFNVREFHSGHFILAASKAKGDTETLITTEDRPETLLVKHLHGDQFSRHLELASWSACADFIVNRMGIGLIPDFIFDKRAMRRHSLKEKIPYTVWIASRQGTDPSILLKIVNKT